MLGQGNAWHYRTPAPYDTNAMSKLFGSRIDLEKIIDEVLSTSSDFDFGGYGQEIHEMTEAKAIGEKDSVNLRLETSLFWHAAYV